MINLQLSDKLKWYVFITNLFVGLELQLKYVSLNAESALFTIETTSL